MSNYPPGFGSSRDLDYVEGPVSEEELDEACPKCGQQMLARTRWRSAGPIVECDNEGCNYRREEEDERE